jgi:hypothetical protein
MAVAHRCEITALSGLFAPFSYFLSIGLGLYFEIALKGR